MNEQDLSRRLRWTSITLVVRIVLVVGISSVTPDPLFGSSPSTSPEIKEQSASQLPSNDATGVQGEFENLLGMNFVRVPAGQYTMGTPDSGGDAPPDVPPHRVRITKPFYIAVLETTQDNFQVVMGYNPSFYSTETRPPWERNTPESRAFAVESVSWKEAHDFAHRLSQLPTELQAGRSYRLPTEAEWEYACRYSRGEVGQLVDKAGGTQALPRNMDRGVWEWCNDWYERDYYAHSPLEDPRGPSTGVLKVIRGSPWVFTGDACRLNHRATPPWHHSQFVGFRVVVELRDSKTLGAETFSSHNK